MFTLTKSRPFKQNFKFTGITSFSQGSRKSQLMQTMMENGFCMSSQKILVTHLSQPQRNQKFYIQKYFYFSCNVLKKIQKEPVQESLY